MSSSNVLCYLAIVFMFCREAPEGANFLARTLDEALDLLELPELAKLIDMVWIIGGSSVYKVRFKHNIHSIK